MLFRSGARYFGSLHLLKTVKEIDPSVFTKSGIMVGLGEEKDEVLHMFIRANGDMVLGQRRLGQEDLGESLARMFDKDPNTRIMLLTADGVTMQQMVDMMDRIYLLGGKSLFVRKWDNKSRKAS